MVIVGHDIYIHSGHDNENEKLSDLWKFSEQTDSWSQVHQLGDIPAGRSGHTLVVYKEFFIMFGGILEVTKESDEIFIYHSPSRIWKLVEYEEGPVNLNTIFSRAAKDAKIMSLPDPSFSFSM